MKILLDKNFPPPIYKVIRELYNIPDADDFDIIRSEWSDEFTPESTILFAISYAAKGVDSNVHQDFKDGYRVFVCKKPYGEGFNMYNYLLEILSHWKKILEKIKTENIPFIYTINERQIKKIA